MSTLWPAAKVLTAAELDAIRNDDKARLRQSEHAKMEYEALAERYGTVGLKALYATLRSAVKDYGDLKKQGEDRRRGGPDRGGHAGDHHDARGGKKNKWPTTDTPPASSPCSCTAPTSAPS